MADNAGIISEPGRNERTYQVMTNGAAEPYSDPEAWRQIAALRQGSWWPEWASWLDARSGIAVAPPQIGAPNAGFAALCDAPGGYVLQE